MSVTKKPAKNAPGRSPRSVGVLHGNKSGLALSLHDMNVISLATQSPNTKKADFLKILEGYRVSPNAIDIVKIILGTPKHTSKPSESPSRVKVRKAKSAAKVGKVVKVGKQSTKTLIANNYMEWASELGSGQLARDSKKVK